jgi:hypothetical protein
VCCVLLFVAGGVAAGASRAAGSPVVVLDTLGSFSTSSAFGAPNGPFGQGFGYGTGGDYWVGPKFTLQRPTTITEIGAFITLVDPSDAPITLQIRPALNGAPDPSRVVGSATLSDDHDPSMYRYESAVPDLTLATGTYFALFVPPPSDGAIFMAYPPGLPLTPLGLLNPVTGYAVLDEGNVAVRILGQLQGEELVPDGAFEQSAFGSYFTAGPCSFAWATDQARTPTHSRRIVATSAGLCRWLSQIQAIAVTPGSTYDASVFAKTGLVQDGVAYLSLNFWTANGTYIPATVDSPQQLSGTKDWTPLFVEAKAPPGAAYIRLEFRLSGRGTAWFDDASLTTASTQSTPAPPDTTILNNNVIGVPAGPYGFAFTSDQFDAGFQCSFDGARYTACTSPVTISLTPGQHTFAVRAVSRAGLVDPTPATQTLTASSATALNLAPDPDFRQDPGSSYITSGDAAFSWLQDNGLSSVGFLQIVAPSNTLNRWLSRTTAIPATPGVRYHVSVGAKTQAVAGKTQLSANFWTADGTYIPATVDSAIQLSGTTGWTTLHLDAVAPAGTAFIRIELRQTGPGTSQFDDIAVTKQ